MKVGVLGSGDVAKVLASGFLKHGHAVKIGSRTAGKLADWAAQNPGGLTGSFADAAEFGELVVLAVKAKPCTWRGQSTLQARRSSTPAIRLKTRHLKTAC